MRKPNKRFLDLDQVKRLVVIAMFSDHWLMENLVLKGGNAVDLVHKLTSRASVDVDFSMCADFAEDLDTATERIRRALDGTFQTEGYRAVDVKAAERPEVVSADIAAFWGGYAVEFKLVTEEMYQQYSDDLEQLRRNAIPLGRGTKFLIDISRFEFVGGKQKHRFDGYTIFVYSPAMIVCEKLRALCQQLPEYGKIVHRGRPGTPRARDFIDIYYLCDAFRINLNSLENQQLLKSIFAAKHVPLQWLGMIGDQRDFHRLEFPAVRDTMKVAEIMEFDFYFEYVLKRIDELEPFWNI